ncbi:unnamed protein product [Amoebophrya sp. A120]|nr:unnamed protein product [Amoebophrya sp. A120]|eukprot:GSA120T00019822001.1
MVEHIKKSLKLFRKAEAPPISFAQKNAVSTAGFEILESELCYHVLGIDETNDILNKILQITNCAGTSIKNSGSSTSSFLVEVGPRQQFTSAQSTHSVSIAKGCGLADVERIEVTKRFLVKAPETSSAGDGAAAKKFFESLVHDRMTECVYEFEDKDAAATLFSSSSSEATTDSDTTTPSTSSSGVKSIRVLSAGTKDAGIAVLKAFSEEQSLGFDENDLSYYYSLYTENLKRDPTDIELFDLAQGNSEHSRHWFFGGKMMIDGIEKEKTLFQIVKNAYKLKQKNEELDCSTIAFEDNSSAQRGAKVKIPLPLGGNGMISAPYKLTEQDLDITLTAETHNFPCGIAPLPGAETGSGGRIRDNHSTGCGAYVQAGIAGYCVGNLDLPKTENYAGCVWEKEVLEKCSELSISDKTSKNEPLYPENMAKPLDILVSASNGASDYGNKFGEPLVAGFTRSYGSIVESPASEEDVGGNKPTTERVEWIKPIMFSGGLGRMLHRHVKKHEPAPGNLIIKIGGPAYRIGVGGGAASSMVAGDNKAELDFNAVQRADAEMARKCECVIRACLELGEKNPILSIHDQGAGGSGNVLKEIAYPAGAKIQLDKMLIGDNTMTALELWVAEFQENDALLIDSKNLDLFEKICKREQLSFSCVGEITGDGKIVVHYGEEKIVDLPLEAVLGKMPQKTFVSDRIKPRFPYPIDSLQPPLPFCGTPPTDVPAKSLAAELAEKDSSGENITVKPSPTASVGAALDRILRLISVGSKRFLTNKVDRSVTGLVAQQQCVGPLHTPLADCAVVAHSPLTTDGAAVSIGEQPLKGLSGTISDLQKQAKLTVAEAVLNLIGVQIEGGLDNVRASGNWMWPAKFPGEGARMYDVCEALCSSIEYLGLAIDGGKDSLSMATRTKTNGVVKCPGEVVLTCYAKVPDVRRKITPEFKKAGSRILFVDLGMERIDSSSPLVKGEMKWKLAGTALAQVYDWNVCGACDVDLEKLKKVFEIFQTDKVFDKILSVHDISDGGFLTCLLEMCFAGNFGADVSVNCSESEALGFLFSEAPGLLLEVDDEDAFEVIDALNAVTVGRTLEDDVIIVKTTREQELLPATSMRQLRDTWESTSFELEKQQCEKTCVEEERMGLLTRTGPKFKIDNFEKLDFDFLKKSTDESPKIPVAVLREEGSNGEREMSWALSAVGFEPWDVTMSDLQSGKIQLNRFQGVIFVGGFSFADTLGSATGWAMKINCDEALKKQFDLFKSRPDTFSLGICNGCQLMSQLDWLGQGVKLKHNKSGRFESRFCSVKCSFQEDAPEETTKTNSVWLDGLTDSVLGVWISHGEGQFEIEQEGNAVGEKCKPCFSYVDDEGKPTETYPMNPNGSKNGVAGVLSSDGRHLAFMPHPERSFISWQVPINNCGGMPTIASEVNENVSYTPWVKLFRNAYEWALKTRKAEAGCEKKSLLQIISDSEIPSPTKKAGLIATSPESENGAIATGRLATTTSIKRFYEKADEISDVDAQVAVAAPPILRMAVLLSGSGTTLQNILDKIEDKTLPSCSVSVVIASRKDAKGIQRAEKAGIPVHVVESRKYKGNATDEDKWEKMSQDVIEILNSNYQVDLIVLAGYMCKFLIPEQLQNKVINVHPSLLPEFGGKGMYGDHVHQAVLDNKRTESGCTVHFVTNGGYDEGPVILQKIASGIDPEKDTCVTVRDKVQALERKALIQVIKCCSDLGVETVASIVAGEQGIASKSSSKQPASSISTKEPTTDSEAAPYQIGKSTTEIADDRPKHECGIAMIKLRKPQEYYQKKYGIDSKVGVDLMYVMLEKQRNRGQDGAGIACVRTDADPGEPYVDVCKSCDKNAIEHLFETTVPESQKSFVGELYLGHVRYGTFGSHSIDQLHPFLRESNWRSKCALLAGNFNLTNSDYLFDRLVESGQHPRAKSDTVTCLEIIGQELDAEHNRRYVNFSSQGHVAKKCQELVEENLDLGFVLQEAAKDWDGGFAMVGTLGTGDAFAIRDRHGIRPCFYWMDEEFIVVASERGVIASAFQVKDHAEIHELTPGHALLLKANEQNSLPIERCILQPETPRKCVFERIYFSRANDPDIYRERLALGRELAAPVLDSIANCWETSVLNFVPNTAEIALTGLSIEINNLIWQRMKSSSPTNAEFGFNFSSNTASNATNSSNSINQRQQCQIPVEKLIFKDAKLRTFISKDEGRCQLASTAYEMTPGIVKRGETTLVTIDDSIVRGTTLKMSMIPRLDALQPKRILFVSSAPQIRFPDCYGIDMSRLDNLVAFRAAVELLKDKKMEHVLEETYRKCVETLRSTEEEIYNQNSSFYQQQISGGSFYNHVKDIYSPFSEEEISAKIAELVTDKDIKTPVTMLYQTVEGMRRAIPDSTGDWVFTGDFPTIGGIRCSLQAFVNFYEGRQTRSYSTRGSEREQVVVIGSGGREHALAWRLSQSKQVKKVYVIPGNGGSGRKILNVGSDVPINSKTDFQELRDFCKQKQISLVVVGPEQPLVDGITDSLTKEKILVFGPTKKGVILEESKAWSKDFMKRWNIPTAEYEIFRRKEGEEGLEHGKNYIDKHWPVVVKASGLAAGKGAIVPKSVEEAKEALTGMLMKNDFGSAGEEVVVEKMLPGRELSVLALSDGKNIKILPLAQDHKRAFDNDEGPNTGGMGAFAPVNDISSGLLERIKQTCLTPCVDGMREEGRPFVGVLFAGLMLSGDLQDESKTVINVLEYNCRFGDPETQAVMPLLEGDFYQALVLCCQGRLDQAALVVAKGYCVSVVVASGGYPNSYEKNKTISGLEKLTSMPSIWTFHAGTKVVSTSNGSTSGSASTTASEAAVSRENSKQSNTSPNASPTTFSSSVNTHQNKQKNTETVTSGGRVLAVSALGRTLEHAIKLAYLGVEQVQFENAFYRSDIAAMGTRQHRFITPSCGSSSSGASSSSSGANQQQKLTYKAAGVDIDAGNALVENIKPFLKQTARPGCEFGKELSFGGFCDLKSVNYKDPVLVSGTDGVGTKLLIANNLNKHGTIGIDLVAMCVNDCLVHGAEPLYFLDYFATGKLSVEQATEVIKGVTIGCKQANCALIGGETAEMPGLYSPGEYDVAGFSVGIVERSKILPRTSELKPGVCILGLGSSGVHSNGLSLARKIVSSTLNPETAKPFTFQDPAPFDPLMSLGDYLLLPTKIYVKQLLKLMQEEKILAAAHITGGGLLENIPRILPDNIDAKLSAANWTLPPILHWLFSSGGLDPMEMARTFNCGIGMAIFVKPEDVDYVKLTLKNEFNESVFDIGKLEEGCGEVRLQDAELAWQNEKGVDVGNTSTMVSPDMGFVGA